ncbi:MAG: hypothetical protein ACOYCA_05815 [Eggerthellaceae bacterium]
MKKAMLVVSALAAALLVFVVAGCSSGNSAQFDSATQQLFEKYDVDTSVTDSTTQLMNRDPQTTAKDLKALSEEDFSGLSFEEALNKIGEDPSDVMIQGSDEGLTVYYSWDASDDYINFNLVYEQDSDGNWVYVKQSLR